VFVIRGNTVGVCQFVSHLVLKAEVFTAWVENMHNTLKHLLVCNENCIKTLVLKISGA
jgi:hypothetical protein